MKFTPAQNLHLSSGFTFIELLVSVMILALIFTVGYGNYRDFARRQRIEAATRDIKGDLRLAQQQALAGQKPTEVSASCSASSAELVGYNVDRTTDHSYDVLVQCLVSGNLREDVIKEVELEEKYPSLQISNFDIVFNALAQGVSGPTTITLTDTSLSGADGVRTIVVTAGGEIN